MTQKKRLGGWQCWVDLHDSYVIKTFKTRDEIKETVEKYLRHIGKLEELKNKADKMLSDIKESTEIIKNSNVPKELIANLEFLEDGRVKQKKVLVLNQAFKELNDDKARDLIDKIADFLLTLWKYGIHEKTFKVFSNLGIDNNDIVLIDVFELSSNKEKVLKQIKKRQWSKPEKYKGDAHPELIRYLVEELNKTLTKENLEKNWCAKLKKEFLPSLEKQQFFS